jgi:hypothetical protein
VVFEAEGFVGVHRPDAVVGHVYPDDLPVAHLLADGSWVIRPF